jgi:hypothetical protein
MKKYLFRCVQSLGGRTVFSLVVDCSESGNLESLLGSCRGVYFDAVRYGFTSHGEVAFLLEEIKS